ncbi:tail fiber assembly protein [Salmonella enterica subsp. enterica]|nr:tail fiber assembly protein [Salmonella enterica subsp. enterica]
MENTIYFSASTCGFYDSRVMSDYLLRGTLPDDAIEMTGKEKTLYYMVSAPAGKTLGSKDNRPAWVTIPPPTKEMLLFATEQEKKRRIDDANNFISAKQWPGKAALGRLKGDELARYNEWLDYLDVLDAVDTAMAPDIEWPVKPE